MISQEALRGWFSKGRRQSEEALEILRQQREETTKRLQNIISQLDGEDRWFVENEQPSEVRCSCGAEDEHRRDQPEA